MSCCSAKWKARGGVAVAVAVASKLSGLPAGLGSQFSLSPGGRRQSRQSSEGEEDTRGKERGSWDKEGIARCKQVGYRGRSL